MGQVRDFSQDTHLKKAVYFCDNDPAVAMGSIIWLSILSKFFIRVDILRARNTVGLCLHVIISYRTDGSGSPERGFVAPRSISITGCTKFSHHCRYVFLFFSQKKCWKVKNSISNILAWGWQGRMCSGREEACRLRSHRTVDWVSPIPLLHYNAFFEYLNYIARNLERWNVSAMDTLYST